MTGADARRPSDRSRPLRIFAIHRYYWPDTPPYASMLRRILRRWRSDGHDVEVLSSQPSYKLSLDIAKRPATEDIDGVKVRRLRLPNETGRPLVRIVNALRLCAAILFRSVVKRYDVIMISTSPPVLGGVAAALGARLSGARFIFHCMDIHPEVGRVSGEFSRPSVFRLLRRLDTWSCKKADPVVVLSGDMEETLRERPGGEQLKITVLNNFNLPSDGPPASPDPLSVDPHTLTVLFAGNVGRFQGLDSVVDAMALLRARDDIEFIIMGEGAAKAELEEKAARQQARVRFVGHQPVEVAKAAMREVDLGYVSLAPDVYRYAFPSKTMTYLTQGCPLIVAVEQHSELARDTLEQGYGFWTAPEDSEALARLLTDIADNKRQLEGMSARALDKARSKYEESAVLENWSRIIQQGAARYRG